MKIYHLIPTPTNKFQFKLSFIKYVPGNSGCYVLTTFEGDILYVGLATNLNHRFRQHLENSEKTNPTKEGKAIWFYFAVFDSKNLPKLERTWLNQYLNEHGTLPILNKISSPIG